MVLAWYLLAQTRLVVFQARNFQHDMFLIKLFLMSHFSFLMVFTCLALSVFSTIQEYEEQAIALLFVMEIIVVIWFSIEFFLRWVRFIGVFHDEHE